MNVELRHRPGYALAEVRLEAGETLVAEPSAMVSMDAHVQLTTSAGAPQGGGVLSGLLQGARRVLAGESFFVNRFHAPSAGRVAVAPRLPGDLVAVALSGERLLVQSGAFVASAEGVRVDSGWGGARGFFSGVGLVLLAAEGHGPLLLGGFGGISEVAVDGELMIDTGHIVAMDAGLSYEIERFGGGFWAMLTSSEGLVARVRGRGRVWIQSRNPSAFGRLIGRLLPARR